MIDDAMNRTKMKRGSALPHAKLDEGDVRMIRELVRSRDALRAQLVPLSNRGIAAKFGVHHRTIEKIVQGESWVHVA